MNFENIKHYNREFENAIIGVCLLEKEAFARTIGIVETKCFYYDASKIIHAALVEMYSYSIPIDLLTITDFIVNRKGIDKIMNEPVGYVVTAVSNSVVSGVHLEYHCSVIKRLWMERELINLTHGGVKLSGDVKTKIRQLSESIQAINQSSSKKDWYSMSDLMYDLIVHQSEMEKTKGMGVTTGIKTLDVANGGFYPGELIVIGARPSVGKSAFIGQMAIAQAKKGKNVGIISLEMNNRQIAARLSAITSNVDYKVIFRNLFEDEKKKETWFKKIRNIVDLPIFVSDDTKVNAIDIRAKAHKLKYQHGIDIMVVDYLQLISAEEKAGKSRENEVAKISRECKLMAKDMNIPFIVLAQLNREVDNRKGTNRYPQLSDLRESGAIEQDADVVMFLHRDWLLGGDYAKDKDGNSTENQADLIVRKWRNGESNLHLTMGFDGPKMMFRQTSNIEQWQPEVDYQNDNPF